MFPSNTRILVVDDMATTRTVVLLALRTLGFVSFIEAEDGEAAFSTLQKQLDKKEPVELVLTDLVMPRVTGLGLVKKIRSNRNFMSLPVIVITAESEIEKIKEVVMAGANAYLNKPITTELLREKLAKVFQHKSK